jgi:hypothetical protein
MTRLSDVVTNRADMHNGVRNATELLTQEVGQAGRVTIPPGITITAATAIGATTVGVSSVGQMFVGEQLVFDAGANQETATITAIAGTQLTVSAMSLAHAAGTPVAVGGGFAAGVVPDTIANGSSGARLKVFGDINGDGNMVYVEYWCDISAETGLGRLYRSSMPFTQVGKAAPTVEQILIDNIQANPDGTPCFTYQRQMVTGTNYIVDVAITLTVRTQRVDPVTRQQQTETKALLNVSPRNVFNVWQLASLGVRNRIQPMPASVQALLP